MDIVLQSLGLFDESLLLSYFRLVTALLIAETLPIIYTGVKAYAKT